jgi:hypothetical protein
MGWVLTWNLSKDELYLLFGSHQDKPYFSLSETFFLFENNLAIGRPTGLPAGDQHLSLGQIDDTRGNAHNTQVIWVRGVCVTANGGRAVLVIGEYF